MADQLQLRRGTTAQIATFTGAQGEVIVDTDKDTLVVQDGITAGGFPMATESDVNDGTFYFNDDTAGGSAADAYILAPKVNTNVPAAYIDGIQLGFVTANANTGPSSANFQGLGVKSLKYSDGSDPLAGDISGRVTLIFDATNDWLEIQRKTEEQEPQVRTVSASVSASALTVSIVAPMSIDFRSTVLTNGDVTSVNVATNINLVVPAGATLGTINAEASRIAIVAINNGGVVELAVINTAGTVFLNESGVISTTAITAGSSSRNVFYSAVARAGVTYRVIGYVESTQAISGTWAAIPSLVQGAGGLASQNDVSFTYIYPNGGTESSPASAAINSRYVESNPFHGYAVLTKVQLLVSGVWEWVGTALETGALQGIMAEQQGGSGSIIVKTGAFLTLTTHRVPTTIQTPANINAATPVRVKVWKVRGQTS